MVKGVQVSLTWRMVHTNTQFTNLVQSVEDCLLAKAKGADGIILSNHGGRQLDFAPPGIAVLARLRMEHPEFFNDQKKFSIFVDGGVRRGTDLLKAVALGAHGCAAGRAILYANSCYGADGIKHATTSESSFHC